MLVFMEVLRGVFVLGRVATSYMAARQAKPQVNPGIPEFHALFANVLVGALNFDLIEVRAFTWHFASP